ncbi:MAG: prolipoprotein diacylglyceryl transferase [Deltaproteobacteria bacterium]|nr:prolipoprotein diacylglyceryl transferase [Deltaproteobacteria bacterium]
MSGNPLVWTWNVDPILAPGFPPLRIYGLLAAFAIVGGFLLFRWQMLRAGHDEVTTTLALPIGLVSLIVGARLGHCIAYDLFRCFHPPWRVLAIWQGGLASHGALVGLLLALPLYARRHRLSFVDLLDRLAFGGAWGVLCVRVGNFFNSEIVGRPTSGTWGVRFLRFDHGLALTQIPPRHPVQLYEALLGLGILTLFLLIDRRQGETRPRGLLASLFFLLYFGGRIALEPFKARLVLPSDAIFSMGQLLSFGPTLLGLMGLIAIARRAHQGQSRDKTMTK